MRSAVTALGVCAAEPRGEEADATDERRRRDQLLVNLGRQWAGRSWKRRKMLRAYQAVVMLKTPINEVAEDHGKSRKTIERWMDAVQQGLVRYYRRPIGEPVEELLGLDPGCNAA